MCSVEVHCCHCHLLRCSVRATYRVMAIRKTFLGLMLYTPLLLTSTWESSCSNFTCWALRTGCIFAVLCLLCYGAMISDLLYVWLRDDAEMQKKIRLAKDATTRNRLEADLSMWRTTAVPLVIVLCAVLSHILMILSMHISFSPIYT